MNGMNRAAQHLAKLYPERGDQQKLASEVDLDQGYVSRLLRDERRPGTDARLKFWRLRKVPMHWWDEPPKGGDAEPESERKPRRAKGAA